MSQSSAGFPDDEEYERDAMPESTGERDSQSLLSPDFQKAAPTDPESTTPPPPPSPLTYQGFAGLPDPAPSADSEPPDEVTPPEAAPERRQLRGAEDPNIAAAVQAYGQPPQYPEAGPGPLPGYEGAYLANQAQQQAQAEQENMRQQAGLKKYLRANGVQMEVQPDGSETIATHDDGVTPRFKPQLSQPYYDEGASRWLVDARDERGNIASQDIMATRGMVHTDPQTGDQFFIGADKQPVLVGKDTAVIAQREVRAQRQFLAQQQQVEALAVEQKRADLQPLLDAQSQLQNSATDDGTTVKKLENQIATLSGSASAFDQESAKQARERLDSWKQQHPEYDQLQFAVNAGQKEIDDAKQTMRQQKARALTLGSDPQHAALASLLPPTLLPGNGPGDVSASQAEAGVADEAQAQRSSYSTALLTYLGKQKAAGAQAVGGQPIDDAITEAAKLPPAPAPAAPNAGAKPGFWTNFLGSLLNEASISGGTLVEGAQRAVGASEAADNTAREIRFEKERASGEFSQDNPYRPGGAQAGEGLTSMIDPARKNDFTTGVAKAASDVPILAAGPWAAVPAFTAKGATEGADESRAAGGSGGVGALKGAGKGLLTLGAYMLGGKVVSATMPAIGAPVARAFAAGGISGAVNFVVDAATSKMFGGTALPQTPAEWAQRLVMDFGFGAHTGIAEGKLPGKVRDALVAAKSAPEQIQLAQANLALLAAAKEQAAQHVTDYTQANLEFLGQQQAATQKFLDAQNPKLVAKLNAQVEAARQKAAAGTPGSAPQTAGTSDQAPPPKAADASAPSGESPNAPNPSQAAAGFTTNLARLDALKAQMQTARGLNDASAQAQLAALKNEYAQTLGELHGSAQSVTGALDPELRQKIAAAVGGDAAGNEQHFADHPMAGPMAAEVGRQVRDIYLSPDRAAQVERLTKSAGADASVGQYVADQHAGMLAAQDLGKVAQGAPIEASKAAALHDAGLLEDVPKPDGTGSHVMPSDDALQLLPPAMRDAAKAGRVRVETTPGAPQDAASALHRGGLEYMANVLHGKSRAAREAEGTRSHAVRVLFTDRKGQSKEAILPGNGNEDQARAHAESRIERGGNKVTHSEIVREGTPGVEAEPGTAKETPQEERARLVTEATATKPGPGRKAPVERINQIDREAKQPPISELEAAARELERISKEHSVLVQQLEQIREANRADTAAGPSAYLTPENLERTKRGFKLARELEDHAKLVHAAQRKLVEAGERATPEERKAAGFGDAKPENPKPLSWTAAKAGEFKPEEQRAMDSIRKEAAANAPLMKALGIHDIKSVRFDRETGGMAMHSSGALLMDGKQLVEHFRNLRDEDGKSIPPEEWARHALIEEIIHRAQFKAAGPEFERLYKGAWEEATPEMQEAARKAYADFDSLPDHEKGAELVRMIIQGRWKGTITERIFKAIQGVVDYLRGLKVESPLLKRAVEGAENVLDAARKQTEPEAPAEPQGDPDWSVAASRAKQTDTPEFKRWFGGSKVVDAKGEPEVMFTGQPRKMEIVPGTTRTELPFAHGFFTDDREAAAKYAGSHPDERSSESDFSTERKGRTYRTFLKIEHPLDLDEPVDEKWWKSKLAPDDEVKDRMREMLRAKDEEGLKKLADHYSVPTEDEEGARYDEDVHREIANAAMAAEKSNLRARARREVLAEALGLEPHHPYDDSDERDGYVLRDGSTEAYFPDKFDFGDVLAAKWGALKNAGFHSYDSLKDSPTGQALAMFPAEMAEEYVKEKGADGYKHTDSEVGGATWITFHPEQTKSATHNSGAFDPENPSILAASRAKKAEPAPSRETAAPASEDEYRKAANEAWRAESPAPKAPSAADRERIVNAYREVRAEGQYPAVPIADVMERAGYGLNDASEGKAALMAMYRQGDFTALPKGDWSLSDARKQAWGVRAPGEDRPSTMMQVSERALGPEETHYGNASVTKLGLITLAAAKAYHGTPHQVDKFSLDKVGTGEGAQVYGHGLYFAENPETASYYKDQLGKAHASLFIDGKKYDGQRNALSGDADMLIADAWHSMPKNYRTKDELIRELKSRARDAFPEWKPRFREAIAKAKSKAVELDHPGNIYTVHLDVEPHELLDWDKPLSEQSSQVKEALQKVAPEYFREGWINQSSGSPAPEAKSYGLSDDELNRKGFVVGDPSKLVTGEALYRELASRGAGDDAFRKGGHAKASALLHEAGIPGIRYLDQGSRDAAEGTRNFVMFDDSKIRITHRNGEPVENALAASRARGEKDRMPQDDAAAHDSADASKSSSQGADYRGQHKAPGKEGGAPLHDLTGGGTTYPPDVYGPKGAQFYGTGDAEMDRSMHALAVRLRGRPDAPITVYRSLPDGAEGEGITRGDWVTPFRKYAEDHAERSLEGKSKIVSKEVRAKDIFTNGDSWHEWGYDPESPDSRAPEDGALAASRSFSIPYAPLGSADLVDAIVEQGGIKLPEKAKRGQEYDDMPTMPGVYKRLVSAGGKIPADEMAAILHDHGLLREPDVAHLWSELEKTVGTRLRVREQEAQRAKEQGGQTREAMRQGQAFEKAANNPREGESIHVENLQPGDKVRVGTETMEVKEIDPDTHDVTLQDGAKFGMQTVKDGQVIYGEINPPKRPATPRQEGRAQGRAEASAKLQPKLDAMTDRLSAMAKQGRALQTEAAKAIRETGREGRAAGAAGMREDLTARHEAMRADIDKIRGDLTAFIKHELPPEERGKLIGLITSALRPPPLGSDSAQMYRRAFKAMGKIAEATEQWHRGNLIEEIQAIAKRSQDSPSVDVNYKAKIAQQMLSHSFTRLSAGKRAELESRKAFVEKQKLAGNPVNIPAAELAELQRLNKPHIDDLGTSALEGLRDKMATLEKLGRHLTSTRETLYDGERRMMMQALAGEQTTPFNLRRENADLPPLEQGKKHSLALMDQLKKRVAKVLDQAQITGRAILPVDATFDQLGEAKGTYDGFLFRKVRNPIDLDYNRTLSALHETNERLNEIITKHGLTGEDSRRIGTYAIAMQEGGRARLEKAMPGDHIDKLIASMTPGELEAYREMRATMDEQYKPLRELMRSLYNEDVQPVKDYFPMVRDWAEYEKTQELPKPIDPKTGKPVAMDELSTWRNVAEDVRPTARTSIGKGFTIERQQGAITPVEIDAFDVYRRHMRDVMHLINTQRDLKMMGEVVRSPEFAEKYGQAGRNMVNDWLDTVARNGSVEATRRIAMLDYLRQKSSVGMVAFRATSMLKHISNAGLAVHHVGAGWYLKALGRVLTPEVQDFMRRNMAETFAREGGEQAIEEATRASRVAALGFLPIKVIDRVNAQTTALGAYLRSMAARGFTPDEALKVDVRKTKNLTPAEAAARESVPDALTRMRRVVASPNPKDAPQVLSRGVGLGGNVSWAKSVFQFGNIFLDRWSNVRHDLWSAGLARGNLKQSSTIALGLLAAIATEAGITYGMRNATNAVTGDHSHDDDEGYLHEMLDHAAKQFPFMGQAMSMWTHGSSGIPVLDAPTGTIREVRSAATAKDAKTQVKHVIKAIGAVASMAGVPGAGQVSDLAAKLAGHKDETDVHRIMRENGIKKQDDAATGQPVRKDLVKAIREKTMTPMAAMQAAVKGGMTPTQAHAMVAGALKDPAVAEFERLPLAAAIKVFDKARLDPKITLEQRQQMYRELQKKHAAARQ